MSASEKSVLKKALRLEAKVHKARLRADAAKLRNTYSCPVKAPTTWEAIEEASKKSAFTIGNVIKDILKEISSRKTNFPQGSVTFQTLAIHTSKKFEKRQKNMIERLKSIMIREIISRNT